LAPGTYRDPAPLRGQGIGTDGVEFLHPAESAEKDLVEFVAGAEEKTALLGPADDLDEASPFGR